MKHEITLNKKEIGQVIEEYFKKNSYDVEDVDVECFMDCEGYGMEEHVVPNVRATVVCKDISLKEDLAPIWIPIALVILVGVIFVLYAIIADKKDEKVRKKSGA